MATRIWSASHVGRALEPCHLVVRLVRELARVPNVCLQLPSLPMTSPMATDDYVEESLRDKVVPPLVKGYADLDIVPQKVTDGLAIEPVRHARVGGYRWAMCICELLHIDPDLTLTRSS